MSYNRVILLGNLTRDPEIRYAPSGAAICKFGIALNHTFTQNGEKKETVTFVDITAFGKTGEAIDKFLHKGNPILVEGRLNLESWKSKTGEDRQKLAVIADSFQFVGSKREEPASAPAAATPPGEVDDSSDVPF